MPLLIAAVAPHLNSPASPRALPLPTAHLFPPAFFRHALHLPESPRKFRIGILQRDFRIDLQKPRQVDRGEQQVTDLFFHFTGILRCGCLAKLGAFLAQLLENSLGILPIEPRAGSFARQLQPFQHGRERARNTVQQGFRFAVGCSGPFFLGGPFPGLDLLPIAQHLRGIFRAPFTEYMRMPPHHLFVHFANHVSYRKPSCLRGDLRMKDDLQQQVAHLLGELGVVAALHGVQHLVGFLD
jgi:hypothetical protein